MPRWIWVTLVPMVWLVAITMTASYQKIFHANPRIGFLAQARVLSAQISSGAIPAEKIAETQRLIFNNRLDAAVTAVLLDGSRAPRGSHRRMDRHS